jgi:hypothetical protein
LVRINDELSWECGGVGFNCPFLFWELDLLQHLYHP